MSATLYYFTGTGNSLYIAKTISSKLPDTTLVGITQVDHSKKICPDTDIVGIIYPTYFVDVPEPVKHFLSLLEVKTGTYLFLYASCGLTLGNALSNPYQLLKERGITVNATFDIVLPDNSIIFPTKPDDQKKMLKESISSIEQHTKIIIKKTITPAPKFSTKDKISGSAMKLGNHLFFGMDKIKIDANKCNNCNTCVKVCSSNNITSGEFSPSVGDNCSMCFSCIHFCPKQAVRFKHMKSKGNYQYKHPEISLSEIINSRIS